MTVITENSIAEPTAVALGIFDGVHAGHKLIIRKAVKCSEKGLVPAVFTFDVDSISQKHGKEYEYIFSENYKHKILENMGVKYTYSPKMTDICKMNGEEFAYRILCRKMNAKTVVCGENFRFGKNAAWGVTELMKFGEKYGFEVIAESLTGENGTAYSSEYFRTTLKEGKVDKLYSLGMGMYAVCSEVVGGNRIGRTLDFPTINQQFGEKQLVPKRGVYSTVTLIGNKTYNSITNIGVKPTVEKDIKPLAETHILDFSGNLYGKEIEVRFNKFIRDEKKFSSLDELKIQIKKDIEYVRQQSEMSELHRL